MGIKHINKHLKDNFEFLFRKVPLKEFRGLRLGIDMSIFSYKYLSPALDQAIAQSNLVDEGINEEMVTEIFTSSIGAFIIKMMNNGIIPIFVFDGKPHPLKDQHAREDRRKKREKAQAELDRILSELQSMDPLLRDVNMYSKMKKLHKEVYYPKSEHYKFLKDFFEQIGIPFFQAKVEADEVLGYLSRNGLVDVIYSDDTDQYAHGCSYIIKELNKDYRSENGQSVTLLVLDEILSVMKMTQDEFIDLCIMFGCDYNKNIRRVGKVGTLKAINQYRRVANLPSSTYDITCLNYPECFSIFTSEGNTLKDLCENNERNIVIDFDQIFKEETEKFLHQHGLSPMLDQLRFFYDSFRTDENYTSEEPKFHRVKAFLEPLEIPGYADFAEVKVVQSNENISLPTDFLTSLSNLSLSPSFNVPNSTNNNSTNNPPINIDFSSLNLDNIKLP